MGGLIGPKHPRWSGGKYKTEKGYIRFSAGEHRHKLEHRVITEENLLKHWGRKLLPGEEVHHIDFKRDHNCPRNLLICGPGFHEAFSAVHAEKVQHKRYKPILTMAASAAAD